MTPILVLALIPYSLGLTAWAVVTITRDEYRIHGVQAGLFAAAVSAGLCMTAFVVSVIIVTATLLFGGG